MNGNSGVLRIETAQKSGKTILSDCYFKAPYKIARPFMQEDGSMLIIVMNASAGILEGDSYNIDMHIGSGSNVTVTDQSYTKIFKMEKDSAKKTTAVTVEAGATLRFLPLPVIPFHSSSFYSCTNIDIKNGGKLIYRDILSCGRLGMGEKFAFSKYRSLLNITYGGHTILHENVSMEPQIKPVGGFGYYEGFTHQAMLYFFGGRPLNRDKIAERLEKKTDIEFGITATLSGGTMIRMLGTSAEQLENECKAVENIAADNS